MSKEEYIKYFRHMEAEDKIAPLGGMAWDDIAYFIYHAIEVDKVFTEEEFSTMFPTFT